MDLDDDELKATRFNDIQRALEILEKRTDYVLLNSDINNAIEVLIDFVKDKIKRG